MRLFYILFLVVGFMFRAAGAETNAVTLIFQHYDQTNISKISDHFFELNGFSTVLQDTASSWPGSRQSDYDISPFSRWPH